MGRPRPKLLTFGGHVVTGYDYSVYSVAFDPDGRRVLTGSADMTAKLQDAETGRELLTFRGNAGPVRSVAFSPDGRRVLTGGEKTPAKLWDAESGRELLSLKGGYVSSVAFSPDGRTVLTGGFDGAKLWKTKAFKNLLEP